MELIIDNIRLVHMNSRLIKYFTEQAQQAEDKHDTLQQTLEGEQSTKTEQDKALKRLQIEFDQKKDKVSLYTHD